MNVFTCITCFYLLDVTIMYYCIVRSQTRSHWSGTQNEKTRFIVLESQETQAKQRLLVLVTMNTYWQVHGFVKYVMTHFREGKRVWPLLVISETIPSLSLSIEVYLFQVSTNLLSIHYCCFYENKVFYKYLWPVGYICNKCCEIKSDFNRVSVHRPMQSFHLIQFGSIY